MPGDIAERLAHALAAEAEAVVGSATAQESPSPSSGASNAPHASTPEGSGGTGMPGGDVSRETSPPETPHVRPSRPAGRPRTGTGPGRAPRSRGRHRRTLTVGALFTAVVIGLCSLLLQSLDDGHKSSTEASSAAPSPGGRQTFSSEELEVQVGTLLSVHPSVDESMPSLDSVPKNAAPSLDKAPSQSEPTGESPLKEAGPSVPVPDCVREGIGRQEQALAAEQGTFEGMDAYLVVLPHATDHSLVSAYIVDASCTRQSFTNRRIIVNTYSLASNQF